jgi:hypothetical protein
VEAFELEAEGAGVEAGAGVTVCFGEGAGLVVAAGVPAGAVDALLLEAFEPVSATYHVSIPLCPRHAPCLVAVEV